MNPRSDAQTARITVYAVAVAHELGFNSDELKVIRELAEGAKSEGEDRLLKIVHIARAFCEWSDSNPIDPDTKNWSDADFSPEALEALERVRPLIQPMNR